MLLALGEQSEAPDRNIDRRDIGTHGMSKTEEMQNRKHVDCNQIKIMTDMS